MKNYLQQPLLKKMKLLNLLFLFSIVSCGGEQPLPRASDSSMEESSIIDNPLEVSTFDFENHEVVYQSLDFLSGTINQHQPVYLKLSPRNEPAKSFFLGSIDSDTSLTQLRLHLPSNIDSIEYQLFNTDGFFEFGIINF